MTFKTTASAVAILIFLILSTGVSASERASSNQRCVSATRQYNYYSSTNCVKVRNPKTGKVQCMASSQRKRIIEQARQSIARNCRIVSFAKFTALPVVYSM